MENSEIIIDYKNLYDYIEDRIPFIFVDKATVIPGKSAKGVKNFTMNEAFFQAHLPGNPLVPAAFLLESMTQTAGLAIQTLYKEKYGTTLYVSQYKNINVYSSVRPGDTLIIETQILKNRRGIIEATGEVKIETSETVCDAEFKMIMPAVFNSMVPKKDK